MKLFYKSILISTCISILYFSVAQAAMTLSRVENRYVLTLDDQSTLSVSNKDPWAPIFRLVYQFEAAQIVPTAAEARAAVAVMLDSNTGHGQAPQENEILRRLNTIYKKVVNGNENTWIIQDVVKATEDAEIAEVARKLEIQNDLATFRAQREGIAAAEAERRAKAQASYSMDIGAALRFEPEYIYGVRDILYLIQDRYMLRQLKAPLAYLILQETIQKYGMLEVLGIHDFDILSNLDSISYKMSGKKVLSQSVDKLIKASISAIKTSKAGANALEVSTRLLGPYFGSLKLASPSVKLELNQLLAAKQVDYFRSVTSRDLSLSELKCKAIF